MSKKLGRNPLERASPKGSERMRRPAFLSEKDTVPESLERKKEVPSPATRQAVSKIQEMQIRFDFAEFCEQAFPNSLRVLGKAFRSRKRDS